jgi:nucleoside-diphosphate-sugar epimerase
MQTSPQNYLVTGGAGFIGSHLVSALIDAGHQVRVLDNFSTGQRERIHKQAEIFEADLCNLNEIRPAFEDVHGVFHFAALPRVPFSIEHPIESNAANVNGTLHMLEAARVAGVKRVVYSASSSAYGDQSTMPLEEDMMPNPMSPYGLQKYVGELYARVYSMCYGIESVSLRYFNVYGPGMSAEGAYCTVVAKFIRQRLDGAPMTITGDGTQTRDFTHVRDVVRANMLAMTSDRVGAGEVINIGGGANQAVNHVAELVGGPKEFIPARLEPQDTLADISRAHELLGWEPEVSFETGMTELRALHHLDAATASS